jgi:iron complex transport system substrate-binding protein
MGEDAINLGGTKTMSLETLFSAQPDFIIASASTTRNLDWRSTLVGAGITVAYFDVQDFDDYLRLLRICTDITGREDLYERNGLMVQQEIEAVIARSRQRLQDQEPPTVLCLVAAASYMKAKNSQGSVLGGMLQGLGCINIADSNTLLLENLSMEYILSADPDYIFVVQRGDDAEGMRAYVEENLLSSPVWQQLNAVKDGRVYFMDKNLFNLKPNHRWGEAYAILEEILSNDSEEAD